MRSKSDPVNAVEAQPLRAEPSREARDPFFSFRFCVDRQPEHGEDAPPVVHASPPHGILAAFDGMGGAGSATYAIRDVPRTGAWIASRLARKTFDEVVAELGLPRIAGNADRARAFEAHLHQRIAKAFTEYAARLDTGGSRRLGGKLIRRLPTTLVALIYEQDGENVVVTTIAAGDSRAYALSPNTGLQQLTTDNLTTGADALKNLRDDSPISNCINADTEFTLNVKTVVAPAPVLLLVATDGCFNYVPTPAHFEWIMLDTLAQSVSEDDWSEKLQKELGRITADDMSLALVAAGWSSVRDAAAAFEGRAASVRSKYIEPLDTLRNDLDALTAKCRDLGARHDSLRQELWTGYKQLYQQLLEQGSDERR